MGKQKIKKTIFSKIDYNRPIKAKEYMHLLEEDDWIESGQEEAYYGSDSAMESHFYIAIYRMVLETDEEYQKRKEAIEQMKKESREKEYETYLRLKKKFENEEENK
jgi:hypothetical protein